MPQTPDLPTAWWLFWLSLGVIGTVLLGVWFLRASRRADDLSNREAQKRREADQDDLDKGASS